MPDKEIKYINPPNRLKIKLGSGGITPDKIARGDRVIKETSVDIIPYAQKYYEDLQLSLEKVSRNPDEFSSIKNQMIEPIMQLKGNCGMFHYTLLSDIAAIALHFLEVITEWNDDAYAVISAHMKTINTIINNKMKGSGGDAGYVLAKELHNACQRYFSKHDIEN